MTYVKKKNAYGQTIYVLEMSKQENERLKSGKSVLKSSGDGQGEFTISVSLAFHLTVGDKVDFVNEAGIVFPGKTVIGTEIVDSELQYFYEPSDTPWYSVKRSRLTKQRQ